MRHSLKIGDWHIKPWILLTTNTTGSMDICMDTGWFSNVIFQAVSAELVGSEAIYDGSYILTKYMFLT